MNVEELVSSSLRDSAARVEDIPDLYATAVTKGRRRRTVRRGAMVTGSVVAVAGIIAGSLAVAGSGAGTHHVAPADDGQQVVADPWWQAWTLNRSDGSIDQAFLSTIDPANTASLKIYAGGTTSDGTEWAMATSPVDGHKIEWTEGWDGKAFDGDVPDVVDPGMTWTSWSFMSRATHNDEMYLNQRWEVVVGQPGTTAIDYSPDGSSWQPVDVHNGIGVLYLANGYPPATAQVRLSNASGVYAQGAVAGAGAGVSGSPPPDGNQGTATPTPTPTDTL
jgi:hypothetical protein